MCPQRNKGCCHGDTITVYPGDFSCPGSWMQQYSLGKLDCHQFSIRLIAHSRGKRLRYIFLFEPGKVGLDLHTQISQRNENGSLEITCLDF